MRFCYLIIYNYQDSIDGCIIKNLVNDLGSNLKTYRFSSLYMND